LAAFFIRFYEKISVEENNIFYGNNGCRDIIEFLLALYQGWGNLIISDAMNTQFINF
jgi:hypothetical protein